MVQLWGSKVRDEKEMSTSAFGEGVPGDLAVLVDGERLNFSLVSLACRLAKAGKRKVHLIHIIEVPRSFPLNAVLPKASERADMLLNSAMTIVQKIGCEAIAAVVQARAAEYALVEEARDHNCALILLGLVRGDRTQESNSRAMVTYVLSHAPCRVWLIQEPPETQPW